MDRMRRLVRLPPGSPGRSPIAWPERRARPLGPVLTASLALHLSILILLLLTIQRRPHYAEQVPPADFAMVFEGHSPTLNSGPNPDSSQRSRPGSPAPGVTVPPVPPTPPAPATPPAAPATPLAAPPTVAMLPPPPPPAPPAQPSAEAHPAPAPAETNLPLPPPIPAPAPLAMAIPRPPPIPAIPRPTETPPATPSTGKPRPERQPERAPAFPTPLAFSFGLPGATTPNRTTPNSTAPSSTPPPTEPARIARPGQPGAIDLSFGPIQGGSLSPSASVQMEGVAVSTDWLNLVSAWWRRHGYYPPQAAANFDDGDVTLHMQVDPDGRVEALELTGKSGSQWLDLGALSVFRDAHLPPLPSDMPPKPIPFEVTVHYVLIRTAGVNLRR
jgi:protein TonB